ncbi:MAG: DedA family protein [Bacteroidales bacterium]|nr:DedA family protein [Bacteroidales bacterium]
MEWTDLGYIGLLVVSFLSATIIPFSSDAVLAVMVGLNYQVFLLWLVASAGNTLGGMTNYYIGKLGKTQWLSKYLKISEQKIERATLIVKKYTSWAAFLSWLPGIGDALALVLGMFKADAARVWILMFLGKSLRYAVIIILVKFGISIF